MVGNSRRHPDRNLRTSETLARLRAAPTVFLTPSTPNGGGASTHVRLKAAGYDGYILLPFPARHKGLDGRCRKTDCKPLRAPCAVMGCRPSRRRLDRQALHRALP